MFLVKYLGTKHSSKCMGKCREMKEIKPAMDLCLVRNSGIEVKHWMM